MRAFYLAGLAGARRRWSVVLMLYAASLALGLVFVGLTWFWLSTTLDRSLATRTLFRDLDMNVFVDLFVHHTDSIAMLGAAAALLLTVAGFIWVWLNVVAVVAVVEPGELATCARRALQLYPTFLRLAIIALAGAATVVAIASLAVRMLTRWMAESPSEMASYWVLFAGAAWAALALLVLTTVHDHARIHSAATGTGATGAYLWSLNFVTIRSPAALQLTLALLATGGVAWLIYQTVGLLIAIDSDAGVILSLVWAEVFVLARAFLRVWRFAAAAELQNVSDFAAD